MATRVFTEENGIYQIECKNALEVIELHDAYNKNSFLNDVDLIVVLPNETIFMEYKNSNIPGASKPQAFEEKINNDDHYKKIARKYYDSLIYFGNRSDLSDNRRKYYYVLECGKLDTANRKMIAGKIKRNYPLIYNCN